MLNALELLTGHWERNEPSGPQPLAGIDGGGNLSGSQLSPGHTPGLGSVGQWLQVDKALRGHRTLRIRKPVTEPGRQE